MSRLGRATERMMGMNDAVWDRHVNPWSGWSRVATLPILAIAIWSRVWLGWWAAIPVAIVLVWIWINPRIFPPPRSIDNWMSQGVLGERIWLANKSETIADHHVHASRLLAGVSGIGAILLLLGLIWLNLAVTLAGMATTILGKLWFLDRMVWIYKDNNTEH